MANPPDPNQQPQQGQGGYAIPLAANYVANPDVAVNDAIAQMGGNPLVRNPFEEYARKFLGAVLPTLFNTAMGGNGQLAMDQIPQQLALAEQFFQGGNQAPYAGLAGVAQGRMKALGGLPTTVLGAMDPATLQNLYGQLLDLGNLGANPALRTAYDYLYGQAASQYQKAASMPGGANLPDFLSWIAQTNPYGIAQNFQTGQSYAPPAYQPPAYTMGGNQAAPGGAPPTAAYGANSNLATLK